MRSIFRLLNCVLALWGWGTLVDGEVLNDQNLYAAGHQLFLRGDYPRAINKFEYLFRTFPGSPLTRQCRLEWLLARVKTYPRDRAEEFAELFRELDHFLKDFAATPYFTPIMMGQFELLKKGGKLHHHPADDQFEKWIASPTWDIPTPDQAELLAHYADYLEAKERHAESAKFYGRAESLAWQILAQDQGQTTPLFIASDSLNLTDLYTREHRQRQALQTLHSCLEFYIRCFFNPVRRVAIQVEEFPFIADRNKLLSHIFEKYYNLIIKDQTFHALPPNAYDQILNLQYLLHGGFDPALLNLRARIRGEKSGMVALKRMEAGIGIRLPHQPFDEKSYRPPPRPKGEKKQK